MRRFPYRFLLFSIASILIQTQALQAQTSSNSQIVWENSTGLKTVSNCTVTEAPTQNLPASISELLGSVIEIEKISPTTPTGGAFFSLAGSFWQLATQNGQPLALRCQTENRMQNYWLFEVSIPEAIVPIARIGVPANASLFQSVIQHSVDEAEALIAKRTPSAVSDSDAISIAADVDSTEASLDYLTCFSGTTLNVRDETLSRVLFTVGKYESVKPVQSFGTDRLQKTIDGIVYDFIKVQFPNRNSNIGWVAEKFVKLRSQCSGAPQLTTPPVIPNSAWTFPTLKRTTDNYKTGMRAFGSSRSGGTRLHAAADLYRLHGDPALSVSSGKVIRDRYYFYQGTYAIEVQHTGGKVVRYGEITGKAAPNVKLGAALTTGQVIGYIGTVNSGCCKPMLHFEMYSGTKTGSLTQSGNKYNRRADLMDPSPLLTTWEKEKFGISY